MSEEFRHFVHSSVLYLHFCAGENKQALICVTNETSFVVNQRRSETSALFTHICSGFDANPIRHRFSQNAHCDVAVHIHKLQRVKKARNKQEVPFQSLKERKFRCSSRQQQLHEQYREFSLLQSEALSFETKQHTDPSRTSPLQANKEGNKRG